MNFQPDEAFARAQDAADPLRHFREQFHIPRRADGRPFLYFCDPAGRLSGWLRF